MSTSSRPFDSIARDLEEIEMGVSDLFSMCSWCKKKVHVEKYVTGKQACEECVKTRCFKCGNKKKNDVCKNCQSEFVALLGSVMSGDEDDSQITTPDDKVAGYSGGVMHYDETENDLKAARTVVREQENYRERAALDGCFNGSTDRVSYCDCGLALPSTGICDLC